jgi:2-(1,2-epoxy-1,2-dihydrophenyl)acetyl-CoA isomerase
MNRPESMNSLSVELKLALLAGVEELSRDDAVRAVVLTGSGRGFCVGQDLREHAGLLETGDPAPLRTVTEHYNPLVLGLTGLPKPVIAAVNGMAAGAGAGIAFACDFRIAAKEAAFLLALGLVNAVVDAERVLPAAQELAARLAAGPTAAYGAIKQSIAYAASSSLPDALAKEAELQAAMGQTEDHRTATAAFVAKQRPVFTGH